MLKQQRHQPAGSHKAAEVVVVVGIHNPPGPGGSVGIPRSPGHWEQSDMSFVTRQCTQCDHTVVGSIQHIVAEAAGHHILQCCNSCRDIQTSYNT